MENVSYTKSGLLSTNISRGDILEYNLLGVYAKSPNRYHTVENDTIINYLTNLLGGQCSVAFLENHKFY